jgi:hypothetical protein
MIICSGFLPDQKYLGIIVRFLSVFYFVLEFADLFKFGGDSVDVESHSLSTDLTPSEIPH